MTQHISFPSIPQFRNVVQQVRTTAKYHNEAPPVLTFTGSIKLHGTNHAVCLNTNGVLYTQSRERVTTLESDNAGSHVWTMSKHDKFEAVFARITPQTSTIQIFGEFCGGNVQSGVGIAHVPKTFVVFAIRVSENSDSQVFMSPKQVVEACGADLLCIFNFPTYSINIDFAEPDLSSNTMGNITQQVETDCPVARLLLGADFDKTLVGEGVVWSAEYRGNTLRFKVKGDKHSSSKVKTLVPVNVEKVSSIKEFVSYVITESRLLQALEHVPAREPEYTGDFIRWIMQDVLKEEMDTILENNLTTKDISGPVAQAARKWFLT